MSSVAEFTRIKSQRSADSVEELQNVEIIEENAVANPPKETKDDSKHLKIIIYMLLVIIVLLLTATCVLIAYVVRTYNNNYTNKSISPSNPLNITNITNITNMSNIVDVALISGLDNYLKAHCVLHLDPSEGEEMDLNGKGVTVIRNPIDIPAPININYSPLLNSTTGEIEYFSNRDSAGNAVPKPKCQTDFETSTYTMKDHGYVFDIDTCEFPLPSWMNETEILGLPRRHKAITHRVTLTTVEVVAEIEEGHTFEFFTYNATVPGPPLRVRVGDWIDLILINPNTSSHEHSVDFHAMSGPGGGAVSLRVLPGQQARTVWQAIIPGMFIYHCASGWISDHISKGMYGAIIVEPKNGFPYSDMDVYLGQGELYLHYPLVNNIGTKFARPAPNLHNTFDPIKERYEMSDVVMFNGAPFALVHNPIVTTVGSVVRVFIVAGGPNHLSSFHMIGDHFDRVWLHGDVNTSPQQNIQTTTVPPGGCAIADWRHDNPGTYIFVDHALTRTFVRGNLGFIRACDKGDVACIKWTSAASVGNKYNCNPNRYNLSQVAILEGNDDCVFCPWSRHDFHIGSMYDETDAIYSYLNQQCSLRTDGFDANNTVWQGNESRYNDTVSNSINEWRKNRFPGEQQWSLSDNLRNADAMKGNARNVSDGGSSDVVFDDSTCMVTVGEEGLISIVYKIDQKGQGEMAITTLRSKVSGGGWISFGRGGDGISVMTDSHVQTVIFNADGSDVEYVEQYNRDYGTPSLDTSGFKFPVSSQTLEFDEYGERVSFTFNILTGDWIIPSSDALTYVPMIVGIGEIGERLGTEQMIKHFSKAILDFSLEANKCVLGGTKFE